MVSCPCGQETKKGLDGSPPLHFLDYIARKKYDCFLYCGYLGESDEKCFFV